jgi:hypothetical protein
MDLGEANRRMDKVVKYLQDMKLKVSNQSEQKRLDRLIGKFTRLKKRNERILKKYG